MGFHLDASALAARAADEAAAAVRQALEHRRTQETAMNDRSSRSHAVFTLCMEAARCEDGGLLNVRRAQPQPRRPGR